MGSLRTPEPEEEGRVLSVQELCDLVDNSTDDEVVRGALGELRRLLHSADPGVALEAVRAILDRAPEDEVRKLCEPHVTTAIRTLVEIRDTSDDPEARKSAADALKDLGWGTKPSEPHRA